MGNDERDIKIDFIKQVYRMLDDLQYECSSRVYTLDEDEMSNIFYLRDAAYLIIKNVKDSHEK